MEKRNRIGILGGTFNPIHWGHLLLAENARDAFDLETILLMPSNLPPHKLGTTITIPKHRTRMVQLAIEDNKYLEFSNLEIEREGITYTIDTLKELKKLYEDTDFYFIVGADSLYDLHRWKDFEEVFKRCIFLAAPRDDVDESELKDHIEYLKATYDAVIYILPTVKTNVSSSDIRERVKHNRTIRYLVPKDVEHYIYYNNLYKD